MSETKKCACKPSNWDKECKERGVTKNLTKIIFKVISGVAGRLDKPGCAECAPEKIAEMWSASKSLASVMMEEKKEIYSILKEVKQILVDEEEGKKKKSSDD